MLNSRLREPIIGLAIGLVAALAIYSLAHAREPGFASTNPQIRHWFQHLMQPDAPEVSCCGEADGYEADDYDVVDGHYVAIITDTRPDDLADGSKRPHIEPGTRINIPNEKVQWHDGNPTGHGYVFLGTGDRGDHGIYILLYCYVPPGGV